MPCAGYQNPLSLFRKPSALMPLNPIIRFLKVTPALVFSSCAAPKAVVVQEEPAAPEAPVAQEVAAVEEPMPLPPDDGIRMPDFLGLPDDNEFRATSPSPTTGGRGGNPVISRPPTDPPPRPKPPASEP